MCLTDLNVAIPLSSVSTLSEYSDSTGFPSLPNDTVPNLNFAPFNTWFKSWEFTFLIWKIPFPVIVAADFWTAYHLFDSDLILSYPVSATALSIWME